MTISKQLVSMAQSPSQPRSRSTSVLVSEQYPITVSDTPKAIGARWRQLPPLVILEHIRRYKTVCQKFRNVWGTR